MQPDLLHVFTARTNPLGWKKPHDNYLKFARHMLESGVHLTVVECAFGEEQFACQISAFDSPEPQCTVEITDLTLIVARLQKYQKCI